MEICEVIITEFQDKVLNTSMNGEQWPDDSKGEGTYRIAWVHWMACTARSANHHTLEACNYKKFFSIILLALVNASHEFIWVGIS